jgi:hypothetical protein
MENRKLAISTAGLFLDSLLNLQLLAAFRKVRMYGGPSGVENYEEMTLPR